MKLVATGNPARSVYTLKPKALAFKAPAHYEPRETRYLYHCDMTMDVKSLFSFGCERYIAESADMSITGVKFFTHDTPVPGTRLTVRMKDGKAGRRLKVDGRVVRSKKTFLAQGTTVNEVAVTFTKLSAKAKQRLESWLKECRVK